MFIFRGPGRSPKSKRSYKKKSKAKVRSSRRDERRNPTKEKKKEFPSLKFETNLQKKKNPKVRSRIKETYEKKNPKRSDLQKKEN